MFTGQRYRVGSNHPAAVRYRNLRIVDLAHAVLSAIGTDPIPEREARALLERLAKKVSGLRETGPLSLGEMSTLITWLRRRGRIV